MHVAAAGMLCEIVLAGMAAIAWGRCEPGMLRYALQNVVISASVVTLLFNLNPLMRFDGYFLLSEWARIPNLAGRGQQAVSRQWQRVLLGIRQPTPAGSIGKRTFVAAYGWAALYWRVLTGIGILIACSTLLHGFGLVLAISCAGMSYAWPLYRTLKSLLTMATERRSPLWRMAAGVLGAGGLLTASFTVIPWPGHLSGHGVVEYSHRTPIRAEASGFVRAVEIDAGDEVTAGQSLFVLENVELLSEATITHSQLEEARDRSRYFLAEEAMAAWQSEEQRIQALSSRALDTQRRLEGLQILAPAEGRVLGRDLEHLVGQWVERGTLLCEIGQEDAKEVIFALPQHDLGIPSGQDDPPSPHLAQPLGLRAARIVPAGETQSDISLTLPEFLPTAEWRPPHPALSGHVGGPLPVQPISDDTSQAPRWQLLKPHLTGHVDLNLAQSLSLRSGERVAIHMAGVREPLAWHLWRVTSDWLHDKVSTAWRMTELR